VALPVPADSEPPLVLPAAVLSATSSPAVAVLVRAILQSSRAWRTLPKNLISRLPEQVRLTGEVSEACLPETSVRAEGLAGDATEQLELRKEVAAAGGGFREGIKTLASRQGPLYRLARPVREDDSGRVAARVFPNG